MQQRITIGELAKLTGVKVVTIRFYEQSGLLPVPRRTEGNYRSYRTEHIQRLQFIRRLKGLGFTLDQVRDLLRLASDKTRSCGEVDRMTNEHLVNVEAKIKSLKLLAAELRRLSACCQGGQIADCRIIEALSA